MNDTGLNKYFEPEEEKEAIEYLKLIDKYDAVIAANYIVFNDRIHRGFLFVLAANEYLKK